MHLFNDKIVQALCWMLIHSLWQGLLLAVIAGILILLTKKSGPLIRYNLLSVLFFVFAGGACFTFARQLQLPAAEKTVNLHELTISHELIAPGTNLMTEAPVERTNLEILVGYFNQHASLIVLIWFIILSAQCVRLIANAGYVQRIRHYKTYAPVPYWRIRMLELAARLQITQTILLLQSELVKVPVMVGFFKPVILFPLSMMMQLPPEQVEAVLLHELAHIKRRDYLVNLFQNFAEIIFFFNPGLLWVSALIRDERENCCDDIAIRESKSKKEFVRALVLFQEYNLTDSKYSVAFPGRKNHLLNRIRRILTNNNKTLNNMEKISLATGIVIIGLITIAFTHTAKKQELKTVPPAIALQHAPVGAVDTLPDKKEDATRSRFNYVTTIDGKEYRILEVNDTVRRLYVDHKRIPNEKLGDYKEVIEKIHAQAKIDRDRFDQDNKELAEKREALLAEEEKMEHDRQNMNGDSLEILNKEKAEMFNDMARKREMEVLVQRGTEDRISGQIKEQLLEQNAELMALNEEVRIQREIMEREAKNLNEKDAKKQSELLNKQLIELKNEQMKIELQRNKINEMLLHRDEFSLDQENRELLLEKLREPEIIPDRPNEPPVLPLEPLKVLVPPFPESKALMLIIGELMDRKIITDKKNLSIILNHETLTVNDIVQPEAIHSEFKAKYLKGPNDHVIYSRHGGSTHADVNVQGSGSTQWDGKENKMDDAENK